MKKVKRVLVTGVFDLLHQEHINFLRIARKYGKELIVAIESDSRVRKLKGQGRPIQPSAQRLTHIVALGIVDKALILPEKFDMTADHEKFLRRLKPDLLVVSAHTPFLAVKRQLMKKIGGQVRVIYKHNPLISTSKLLRQASKKNVNCI